MDDDKYTLTGELGTFLESPNTYRRIPTHAQFWDFVGSMLELSFEFRKEISGLQFFYDYKRGDPVPARSDPKFPYGKYNTLKEIARYMHFNPNQIMDRLSERMSIERLIEQCFDPKYDGLLTIQYQIVQAIMDAGIVTCKLPIGKRQFSIIEIKED